MYMQYSPTWHVSYGDGEMTFDLPPLADDGHLVDQRGWLQQITQVHKGPAVTVKRERVYARF